MTDEEHLRDGWLKRVGMADGKTLRSIGPDEMSGVVARLARVIMDLKARVEELEGRTERELEVSLDQGGRIEALERWRAEALRDWARMMPPHGDQATDGG